MTSSNYAYIIAAAFPTNKILAKFHLITFFGKVFPEKQLFKT